MNPCLRQGCHEHVFESPSDTEHNPNNRVDIHLCTHRRVFVQVDELQAQLPVGLSTGSRLSTGQRRVDVRRGRGEFAHPSVPSAPQTCASVFRHLFARGQRARRAGWPARGPWPLWPGRCGRTCGRRPRAGCRRWADRCRCGPHRSAGRGPAGCRRLGAARRPLERRHRPARHRRPGRLGRSRSWGAPRRRGGRRTRRRRHRGSALRAEPRPPRGGGRTGGRGRPPEGRPCSRSAEGYRR